MEIDNRIASIDFQLQAKDAGSAVEERETLEVTTPTLGCEPKKEELQEMRSDVDDDGCGTILEMVHNSAREVATDADERGMAEQDHETFTEWHSLTKSEIKALRDRLLASEYFKKMVQNLHEWDAQIASGYKADPLAYKKLLVLWSSRHSEAEIRMSADAVHMNDEEFFTTFTEAQQTFLGWRDEVSRSLSVILNEEVAVNSHVRCWVLQALLRGAQSETLRFPPMDDESFIRDGAIVRHTDACSSRPVTHDNSKDVVKNNPNTDNMEREAAEVSRKRRPRRHKKPW